MAAPMRKRAALARAPVKAFRRADKEAQKHQERSVSMTNASDFAPAKSPQIPGPTPSLGAELDPPPLQTYDFEDDLVTGDLVRPDGEQLIVRRRGRRASLIQIREHFIPEMLKSVEDL